MDKQRALRKKGLDRGEIFLLGMIFLTLGLLGRGLLQNRVLGIGTISNQELLQSMEDNRHIMWLASVALFLQGIETCAVPIFALLSIEKILHAEDLKYDMLWVLGVAMLSEIPYHLVLGGKILGWEKKNPVFGIFFGLLMLWFYQQYQKKSLKNIVVRITLTLAAAGWCLMFRIEHGGCLIFLISVFWIFKEKPAYRNLATALAAALCSLVSPFFLVSPMGVMVNYFYNGEEGNLNRKVRYLAYPMLLLVVWVIGKGID